MMFSYDVDHESHTRNAITSVEKIWPGEFNFFLFEAEKGSDKLEVTVFPR